MSNKPLVFVITPFSEDFLALYEHLKSTFSNRYEFTNAGDLDNQQNILRDIIHGIHQAQIIIADVTGLNANVFYELGLAHAMNKKVIIITQDINELPFDIKSYRVNEYSLMFNKLPHLIEKLESLLSGALDNTVTYGNPVSDFLPNFFKIGANNTSVDSPTKEDICIEICEDEKGFLDYISDIQEYTNKMTCEINTMSKDMQIVDSAIVSASNEINRVKSQSGNTNISFVKSICRKISGPTELFASQLKGHAKEISNCWNVIENSYLSLLDNQYVQKPQNIEQIKDIIIVLENMQREIHSSNDKMDGLASALRNTMGIERKLNKATSMLITELESYLLTTDTMSSSIDRITNKSKIVIEKLETL